MNANDSELRKRMRSLSKKIAESLSEEDIYSSLGFRKYLLGLAETMKVPGLVNLILDSDPHGKAGWTNKSSMYVNYMHPIVRRLETPEARFMCVLAIFFHECAHNKFCDFDEDTRIMEGIQKGIMLAEPAADQIPAFLIPAFLDLKAALAEPGLARGVVEETMKDLSNIVDDVHDENAMIGQFGDFVGESIYLCRSSLHEDTASFEEMQSLMRNQKANIADHLSCMLFQFARFGYVASRDEEKMAQDDCYQLIRSCVPYIEAAAKADDKISQYQNLWIVMAALWLIYAKIVDDMQELLDMLKNMPQMPGFGQGGDPSGEQDESDSNDQQQGSNGGQQQSDGNEQEQSDGQGSQSGQSQDGDDSQQDNGSSGDQQSDHSDPSESGRDPGSQQNGCDPQQQSGNDSSQQSNQGGSDQSSSGQQASGQSGSGGDSSGSSSNADSRKNNEPQQSNQGAGSFQRASDDMLQQMLDAMKKAAEQIGSNNNDANGRNSSLEAVQNRVKARKAPRDASEAGRPENASQGDSGASAKEQEELAAKKARDPSTTCPQMAAVIQAVAKAEAEVQLAQINAQDLGSQVNAVNRTSPHEGIPLHFERVLKVTDQDRHTYDAIMAPLLSTSKRLQKKLLDALRDIKEGYVTKRRHTGKIFCANDSYRPDQRYFANKKLPEDFPDMAITILVDHSGSMNGERIKAAQKASMLLYDFAVGLGIPVSVAGHYASGKGVYYRMYTEFDKFSKDDRYRLSQMGTAGCNRDGLALNVAVGLLLNRPEEIKLLIIISDGQPNHDDYGGEAAAKDIQEIVKDARKRGVEIMAAAIGSDRGTVGQIYTDGFLDIADLNELPKTMVNIVKNRIIKNAF